MRVATYNILADTYVRPEFYPLTPRDALSPEQRRPALLERIAGLSADVICLQEVEEGAYKAIAAHLAGYEGLYARKGSGKPDGCATFWRGMKLLSDRLVRYPDGSGHLALLVELELEGRRLGIASSHLKWEAPDSRAGLSIGQMSALLAAVDANGAWVACGDFNATPSSGCVRKALSAGFLDPYAGRDAFTCCANGRPQRIDYLLHTGSLVVRPAELRVIDATTPLPSEREPSDHLPLVAEVSWAL